MKQPELECEESAAKRNVARRAKLRRKNWIQSKRKKINNELFSPHFNYSSRSDMFIKLRDTSDEINKNRVN